MDVKQLPEWSSIPGHQKWPSQLLTSHEPHAQWCLKEQRNLALSYKYYPPPPDTSTYKHTHTHTQKEAKPCNILRKQDEGIGNTSSPILMVAWREITSGDSGFSFVTSSLLKSCSINPFLDILAALSRFVHSI